MSVPTTRPRAAARTPARAPAPLHVPMVVLAMAISTLLPAAAHAGTAAGETRPADPALAPQRVEILGTAAPGGLPRDLPANSAGYSAEELREQVNVIDTADIVKYSPDTMTRKRYIGDRNAIIETRTASVTSSARALVYVDDILLSNLLGNGYAFPARWSMVSPAEIARVDFFFGPYSAEFPGNSIGTTVLMTTRMPAAFEAHGKVQGYSESFSGGGTAATYQGSHLEATVGSRSGGLSWRLGVDHLDSNGHPMSFVTFNPATDGKATGSGPVVEGVLTDTDTTGAPRLLVGSLNQEHTVQDSARLRLAWQVTPGWQAGWLLGTWHDDATNRAASYLTDTASGAPVTGGTFSHAGRFYSLGNAFAGNTSNQTHWLDALTLRSNRHAAWDVEAVLARYDIAHDVQHSAIPAGAAVGGSRYFGQVSVDPSGRGWLSADAKLRWHPRIGGPGSHQLVLGLHHDRYELDSRVDYTDAAPGDDSWKSARPSGQLASASSGTTRTSAAFAQDAWTFAPEWKATAGLRLERWRASDGGNTRLVAGQLSTARYADRGLARWSPKLALEHAVSADWTVRAAFGDAWRMPTVTELFQSITVGTSVTEDNPALRPEHARSAELTAEHDLARGGLLRLSWFGEDLHDALLSQTWTVGAVTTSAVQNVDHVRSSGATLAWQQTGVLPGLDLTGSVTYARARTLADAAMPAAVGKVFPGVPTWRATAVATWHPDERLSATLAARLSGDQYNTLANTDTNRDVYGSNSRYVLVDLRVARRFDHGLKAAIGIDNLTNRACFAYHPMPMRTVHAELAIDL